MATSTPRLYFAYGSNLSLAQMASRCPTSSYHSFGMLKNYKWIIGEPGYANVIETPGIPITAHDEKDGSDGEQTTHVVYGMLYTLEPEDEVNLDLAEGVPDDYTKHVLDIELVSREFGSWDGGKGSGSKGEKEVVEALVYVDQRRLGEGVCQTEYVGRINRGVRDAVSKGMERWYVERYIRPFVPEREVPADREVGDPFHPKLMGA